MDDRMDGMEKTFDAVAKALPAAGVEFPRVGKVAEPPQKKMDSMEYIRFCDFCIKNNPHITAENCLQRKTGEEDIKVPFHF